MKTFGLTGGIGMGKSAAAQSLLRRGLPVVDTDLLARSVVEPGTTALEEIRREFGAGLVGDGGRLNRKELARIVFSDPKARQALERITHPRIRKLWMEQLQSWRAEGRQTAVVVIPLLFETSAENELDTTVCVACSQATQRQRLLERGWNNEQIQQRINAQWPIEKKIAQANFVIWSEGGLDILEAQLDRVFKH